MPSVFTSLGFKKRTWRKPNAGFTLIEVVLVIVIIAIVSAVSIGRLDSVLAWKQKGDIRKFVDTWTFLYNEAVGRQTPYRLVIDIENNSYYVRREVPIEGPMVRNVDYLKNLRTKGEKERRAKQEEEEEDLRTLEEEYEEDDTRQSGSLEKIYYDSLFNDPEQAKRLAIPLEFPNLAETKFFTDGLEFRDVKMHSKTLKEGTVVVRFSPRGASEFAVVHLQVGEQIFTAMMNPSTGKVDVKPGDLDFEWTLGKKQS